MIQILLWGLSLSLLLMTTSSPAKKYYKHVDENGITHYSDKPPKDADDFESFQVRPEDSQYEVRIINRGTKHQPIFYAVNPYHGPVEVRMAFINRYNVEAEPRWPARYVVPANDELYLATVKAIYKDRNWSFNYKVESTLGDPNAKHDSNHPYRLPFIGNKHFYISQGFNGKYTHKDAQNRYALDIVMPEGSDILAARGGVVMDIAEDFYDGGVDAKHLHRGNYIRILHDDGSMAIYAHLKLESVVVARGQRVEALQKIAQSGNTGFTSGPHLHFAIQINDGLRMKSLPFLLKHKSGQIKTPKIGPI
jgi:murein DD-endopeptidase MepM/ murein hydrolase activator NlpD